MRRFARALVDFNSFANLNSKKRKITQPFMPLTVVIRGWEFLTKILWANTSRAALSRLYSQFVQLSSALEPSTKQNNLLKNSTPIVREFRMLLMA